MNGPMRIWLARDKAKVFQEQETCLFFGKKPVLDNFGIWRGTRWPVPPLSRLLAPGDICEMAIEVEVVSPKIKKKRTR